MSFFKQLSSVIGGLTVHITVSNNDGKLTVLVVPHIPEGKDKVNEKILPLSITGLAEDIDQQFITLISTSLSSANQLKTNLDEHVKSLEKAKPVADKTKPAEKKADAPSLFEDKSKPAKADDAPEMTKDIVDPVDDDPDDTEEEQDEQDEQDDTEETPDPPFVPDSPKADPIIAAGKDEFGEENW